MISKTEFAVMMMMMMMMIIAVIYNITTADESQHDRYDNIIVVRVSTSSLVVRSLETYLYGVFKKPLS